MPLEVCPRCNHSNGPRTRCSFNRSNPFSLDYIPRTLLPPNRLFVSFLHLFLSWLSQTPWFLFVLLFWTLSLSSSIVPHICFFCHSHSSTQIPLHMIANLFLDPGFQTTHEKREGFLLGHFWYFVHLHTECLNVRWNVSTHFDLHQLSSRMLHFKQGGESLLHFLVEICPTGLGVAPS